MKYIHDANNAYMMVSEAVDCKCKRRSYDVALVAGTRKGRVRAMALVVDDDARWNSYVKRIIRSEMTRRGITYDEIAAKLEEVGVKDSSANIRNKVARGKFSAAFFVQCLTAIGCSEINITKQ